MDATESAPRLSTRLYFIDTVFIRLAAFLDTRQAKLKVRGSVVNDFLFLNHFPAYPAAMIVAGNDAFNSANTVNFSRFI